MSVGVPLGEYLRSSAIRELLERSTKPGVVTLAGGLPHPEMLPNQKELERLYDQALEIWGNRLLNYGRTEGFAPFLEASSELLNSRGIYSRPEDIYVNTNGSQGILDVIGQLMFDPKSDIVAVASPSYVGALQIYASHRFRFVALPSDDEGIIPEGLAQALEQVPIQLLYLVPTFDNPGGTTMSEPRRHKLAQIIREADLLTVEDDPYSDLYYGEKPPPPLKTFAPNQVIYMTTFSKTWMPDARLGIATVPENLMPYMIRVSQGKYLYPQQMVQAQATMLIRSKEFQAGLDKKRSFYGQRMQQLLDLLEQKFPTTVHWSKPDGGFFVWVQAPGIDLVDIAQQALEQKVAVVPGLDFFPDPEQGRSTMRLSISAYNSFYDLERAIVILGNLLSEAKPESAPKISRTYV